MTAYAEEDVNAVTADYDADTDGDAPAMDTTGDAGDIDIDALTDTDLGDLLGSLDLNALLGLFLGGGLSFDTDYSKPENLTPDGTGTVMDNVFIYGNDLEFFTFTTEAGNVFFLVIDRSRTKDNVYFLNAVNEWDLMALAQAEGGTGTNKPAGSSMSGIPNTPGGTNTPNPGDEPDTPEEPPAKKGGNTGMLIFLLIGAVVVGGVAYYFKILKPKQQRVMDDDDGVDIEEDDDDYDGDDAGDDFDFTDDGGDGSADTHKDE